MRFYRWNTKNVLFKWLFIYHAYITFQENLKSLSASVEAVFAAYGSLIT